MVERIHGGPAEQPSVLEIMLKLGEDQYDAACCFRDLQPVNSIQAIGNKGQRTNNLTDPNDMESIRVAENPKFPHSDFIEIRVKPKGGQKTGGEYQAVLWGTPQTGDYIIYEEGFVSPGVQAEVRDPLKEVLLGKVFGY